MTARKDQSQAIIFQHGFFRTVRDPLRQGSQSCKVLTLRLKQCPPADQVYGFISPGGNEPGPGIGGRALASPLLQRRSKGFLDRKSTRLNSSHLGISYAVFCLKKKKNTKSCFRLIVLHRTV